MRLRFCILGLLLTAAAAFATPPDFHELYGLVRSNLAGVDQKQLDDSVMNGLSNEFAGRVIIVDGAAPTESEKISRPEEMKVFDGGFGYFGIADVSEGSAAVLRRYWDAMTNLAKIKGVVLDLRFAGGTDYAAAGAAADDFLSTGEPLLEWPGGLAVSTNKDNAIAVPVVVLINSKTRGAAEALAAVLRASDRALTIGGKTAGQASVFKDFPLTTGQKVRIATADVKLAGGPSLAGGLTPDIAVDTTLAEDLSYLREPYKEVRLADGDGSSTNSLETVTNTPEPRFDEAELVREHRAGINPGEDLIGNTGVSTNQTPLLADPSLSRALDVLKGLSVMNGGKPS